MLAGWPVGAASPEPSTATPVRAPLAVDGSVRQADLQHDSRSDLYRSPTGAVPAGVTVELRLRAAAGDLASAEMRLTDTITDESWVLPMTRIATDPDAREHGVDYWAVTLKAPAVPTVLEYSFVAQDGQSRRYITDDAAQDGGTGNILRQTPTEPGWQLTVHGPAFRTPEWTRGAVVYQVFPDRFANGDTTNDPSPDATPGPSGAERFRYGDVYGNPVQAMGWDALPEGFCRAYQDALCYEQPLGRDFYGGDLAGITAHLDDLAARGITALYLNPVFAAPSNHRYDTSDYFTIDPDLGTDADFDALIAGAHERGIKVILDGVFNHVSSDSPWFDRLGRYEDLGACESADSPYRSWFTFRAPGPGEPSPCAPSIPGGDDTFYASWAGFDTIPALVETPEVVELITGEEGVVRHWLRRGIDGWRLDVADDISPELLRAIRSATKSEDPDAIVIVEQWGDSSKWLLGDQGDSTMDYRFRRAVIGLINGATADLDGSLDAVTPTQFANAMLGMQEDYPAEAWDALLHMVDSHDTTRILWTLTPAVENDTAKAAPEALAEGKASQALLATIQLTFPGMASIFYGDEVGLTGHDDPDDRRPYPWEAEDAAVLDTYHSLALLRQRSVALREGQLTFLDADDAAGTLAYLRRADTEAAAVALNLGDQERQFALDVAGRLPDGTRLERPLDEGGAPVTVTDGTIRLTVPGRTAVVLLTAPLSDLTSPAPPGPVEAIAGAGRVDVSWKPVAGAVAYQVWRSLVPGGGYEPVATTGDVSLADTTVRNGAPAYYVVTALDDVGNRSSRSPETAALPQVSIATVRAVGDARRATARSSIGDGIPLAAQVTIARGDSTEPAAGIAVEVGLGPVGSDPDAAWAWSPAHPDGADGWLGHVRPEELGTFSLSVRASSDGGLTWVADMGAGMTLDVVPSSDVQPPAAPAELRLVDVGDDHVTIGWPKVTADDLQRYVVYRSSVDAREPVRIATTTGPVYQDTSVTTGTRYEYAVTAQDLAFNESPLSPSLSVDAAERVVAVTFRVSVPSNTPASDSLFIAGDFQGWAPGQTPMTRIDDSTWSITLPFEDGTSIEYKYTRGSWEAVEKDDGCGEIANRTMTADFGTSQEQVIEDVVDKWRDVDRCG
jgi:glycosidase